jgi:hypothetical protein
MSLAPKYTKTINDIADLLYHFLPGKSHPFANQNISFQGVANELGLIKFWSVGSKLPAINMLLSNVYEYEKGKFCKLITAIVNKSIVYRAKNNPLTKNEIIKLNDLIVKLDFKIPELWDKNFLDSLVDPKENSNYNVNDKQIDYDTLLKEFVSLKDIVDAQKRGYAFEKFLNKLFEVFELNPRQSFRITGEQIDGSLELDNDYYLIEAKWQKNPVGSSELFAFGGKIEGKSKWTRGIIISYNGFSKEGIESFGRGRQTSLIAIDGTDLYTLLSKNISFVDGLRKKIRWAAETGEIAKNISQLFD